MPDKRLSMCYDMVLVILLDLAVAVMNYYVRSHGFGVCLSLHTGHCLGCVVSCSNQLLSICRSKKQSYYLQPRSCVVLCLLRFVIHLLPKNETLCDAPISTGELVMFLFVFLAEVIPMLYNCIEKHPKENKNKIRV